MNTKGWFDSGSGLFGAATAEDGDTVDDDTVLVDDVDIVGATKIRHFIATVFNQDLDV